MLTADYFPLSRPASPMSTTETSSASDHGPLYPTVTPEDPLAPSAADATRMWALDFMSKMWPGPLPAPPTAQDVHAVPDWGHVERRALEIAGGDGVVGSDRRVVVGLLAEVDRLRIALEALGGR